jgi:hypothetical protein
MNGARRTGGNTPAPGAGEDFARDLEQIRAAWSRQERAVPPDLVDQAVLNAARRASENAPRRGRWVGVFATACVVVLAVTVVVQQNRDAQGPLREVGNAHLQDADSTSERLDDETARPAARLRNASKPQAAESRVTPLTESRPNETDAYRERKGLDATATPAAPPGSEQPRAEAAIPTPEAWIERLEQLLQAGDYATFEAERAAFRSAYPDYPLPSELRD